MAESGLSGEVDAVTVLLAPSGLSSSYSDGTVSLYWTNNDDSSDGDFEIDRSNDGGSTWTTIDDGLFQDATSYNDSPVPNDSTFTYRVRRVTNHASATSGTTSQSTLYSPSNLSVSQGVEDQIDLTWNAGSNEDGYYVYRAESSGSSASDYSQVADLAAGTTSYTNGTLEDGERYFYRVSAYSGTTESSVTNESDAITVLPSATNVTATKK